MKNCIYKFMNRDGEVIYIGKAKDLKSRLSNHKHLTEECYKELAYILYASFDTEHEMDFAERYYIQKLTPRYNTTLSDKPISFTCDDLDNIEFDIYKVNQFVIEETFNQVSQLKKEELNLNFDCSLLELIGLIYTILSSHWNDINNKKCDANVRSQIKQVHENTFEMLIKLQLQLSKKYNLLEILFAPHNFLNQKDYVEGANFKENTFTFNLLYRGKYDKENTSQYKKLDIIIKCK